MLQRSEVPKPHRARSRTLFPLPQKQEYETDESKRTHWYWNQRLKLGKVWGNTKRSNKPRLGRAKKSEPPDDDSDHEECFWLPDDVDSTSFSSVSLTDSDSGKHRLEPRRWSFDEKESAYPDIRSASHQYPFLTGLDGEALQTHTDHFTVEPGFYFPRTGSLTTSSNSSKSSFVSQRPNHSTLNVRESKSTTSSSPSRSHKQRRPIHTYTWFKLLRQIARILVCIFNTLFLCAPFTALARKLRKEHAERLRSKQFPHKSSHIRKYPRRQRVQFKYSSRSSRGRTFCRMCDRDFDLYDGRRRWTKLTAEAPRRRSQERAAAMYVFSPRHTVHVLGRLVRPWVKGQRWWERLRASLRYVALAGMKDLADNEDEEREREREEWRS